MPDCVKVARQTLTLFVRVQILHPQPYKGAFTQDASFFIEKVLVCQAVGRKRYFENKKHR